MRAQFLSGGSSGGRRRALSWARAIRAAGPILAASLGALACGPAGARTLDVHVDLHFDPAPRVGRTTCTVRLSDEGGAPLTGATVGIEGNMNHAGMVPAFGAAVEAAPGLYQAPLEFTMGGDWFVIVRAELADGRAVEQVLDVPGVAVMGTEGATSSRGQPESR